ncbi:MULTISPECIES: MarR family winged helix-turn-helix transcriptional regulator [Bacillus cereus group]|uniref:MarR family winged helix-turn-helix transcriptional regulator n=1 Tax=Bacillus cereus group TaxID=86661 RepID=UPI000B4465F7|nr:MULTISPECIES: MarR family transcriptional regulator [Bacillus cereus group]NKX15304.1 MarR family transcriptional regulator [Bacillus cereus]MBH0345705.1 MarR family transcriptional regulator [Bacillus thuringiensis]NRR17402.1 MarR family transcriptional regulator [Bacillus pacificus]OTY07741.1 MarR family transcriptional regulator [Bacillus thuringiensis serovar muju]HDR7735901.1 MarR family transcriptional regulator [Bacillus thuringiensis]
MDNKNRVINSGNFIPSLEQSKRQIEHYNLDVDAQSILVASRLMVAGAKLNHAAEIHFSKFGLSTGRYRLLADLEDNGGKELPSQLAEHLDVTRATVTGLIDILKRDGLISRESSAEDGRQKLVALTEKGRSKLIEMAPEHFDWLESIVSLLTIEERTVFLDLLGRVTQRISLFVEQSDQLKDIKE